MSERPEEVLCDYCGARADFVDGAVIYPHRPDLSHKRFWRCVPCGAYVGCHGTSGIPLGRLADAELRRAKQQAHAAFDPLWQHKVFRSRGAAYRWLAEQLGISTDECHIGMMDVDRCAQVVRVCSQLEN